VEGAINGVNAETAVDTAPKLPRRIAKERSTTFSTNRQRSSVVNLRAFSEVSAAVSAFKQLMLV
jgi:hypothetical protein